MGHSKKFIAPGAWFSMEYPMAWSEFEDAEGSFLFYNPDTWTGNFRISAYRGDATYGKDSVEQELRENPSAVRTDVGGRACAYSREMFMEEGTYYTSHIWIVGMDDLAFECTFTVRKGASVAEAEQVIRTLAPRKADVKYPAEIIPVRLLEIFRIDEAYEWVEKTVKEVQKKDFQGIEEDIPHMQRLVDEGLIGPKKKEGWLSLGIVLCVILANEIDGWEWRTLIDGNREAPILWHVDSGRWVDPMKLVWSKVKAGEPVDLAQAYLSVLSSNL